MLAVETSSPGLCVWRSVHLDAGHVVATPMGAATPRPSGSSCPLSGVSLVAAAVCPVRASGLAMSVLEFVLGGFVSVGSAFLPRCSFLKANTSDSSSVVTAVKELVTAFTNDRIFFKSVESYWKIGLLL